MPVSSLVKVISVLMYEVPVFTSASSSSPGIVLSLWALSMATGNTVSCVINNVYFKIASFSMYSAYYCHRKPRRYPERLLCALRLDCL